MGRRHGRGFPRSTQVLRVPREGVVGPPAQTVNANAIAAATTVHAPDRIDQEVTANAIAATTTVHAPAQIDQEINANAIAATTVVHSPAAEGGVQPPVTAEVITPIPFAIGRLSFTVEAHLTFRWRHFFGAMVAEDDTVGAETVSLSLGWTALAPVEADVALGWGHLAPVASSHPLSWTVTGLIDVVKAIRDLQQLLIYQAERAPQPQPLLLSRPLPVVAKRLGPVETSITLSWGHDRELEDLLVAGIFSDTALHAWLDDAPSSVLIPAGTSDGDGEEIGKHKGHWGGGHPKGGDGGAGGAGEADGGGGGGGAGLTGEQHEALAPAQRFNAGLKGETEAKLRSTQEGATLADALDDFQHGEGAKSLRAGITKEANAPGTGGPKAQAVTKAIRGAPPSDQVLYRGMRVPTSQKALLEQYQEGGTIDMNLSSFSTSHGVANVFSEGAGRGGSRVIIGVVGQHRSLPIQNLAKNSSVFSEKEFITGGRFRVLGADRQGGALVVTLQQTQTL